MHLICQALPKSIQRQAFGDTKSGSLERCISRGSLSAADLQGVSLQNSAVTRLDTFQVLNHRQQSEGWGERSQICVIRGTRKDAVAAGEKQDAGRRRGRERKGLTLLMGRNTNTRGRDTKAGIGPLKFILQFSRSPSLDEKAFTDLRPSHKNRAKLGVLLQPQGPAHQLHPHAATKTYFFRESEGGREYWQGQHEMKEKGC